LLPNPGIRILAKRNYTVQQVATGALKAYGITSKEKLPEFPNAVSLPVMFGPKLDVVY
jgi:hypothetical protein